MRFPKMIFLATFAVFALIAIAGAVKKLTSGKNQENSTSTERNSLLVGNEKEQFPYADQVHRFFSTSEDQFPIVETIAYSSRVPWLKGRPAWIADYAAYYSTSRHFIARSVNKKADYQSQKVSFGSKFNVFKKDRPVHFYLLIDLSRCKMGLYYHDLQLDTKTLVKTYEVGVGKLNMAYPSGSLTPTGHFTTGQKVSIYQAEQEGIEEKAKRYGTRAIPIECAEDQELMIHGAPWSVDEMGLSREEREYVGHYSTEGGICLFREDVEELFSIIITKPTFVEIVRDFRDADILKAEAVGY